MRPPKKTTEPASSCDVKLRVPDVDALFGKKTVAEIKSGIKKGGIENVKVGVFDTDGILRGKYLSAGHSARDCIIQYPDSSIQRLPSSCESQKISPDPPERDRSRTGSLSAESEYETRYAPQGDAVQPFCRRQTIATDSLSRRGRGLSRQHR